MVQDGKDNLVETSIDRFEYAQGYVQCLIDTVDEITQGVFAE